MEQRMSTGMVKLDRRPASTTNSVNYRTATGLLATLQALCNNTRGTEPEGYRAM
jgi:hypothetical protein